MKTIQLIILILSLTIGSKLIAQKSNSKVINMNLISGIWSPVDSIYTQMQFRYTCLEITQNTFMTFECINKISSNSKCPYKILNNEIRVICHELEQVHYKILKLTESELEVNVYQVKQNGKLKLIEKNRKYIRREI